MESKGLWVAKNSLSRTGNGAWTRFCNDGNVIFLHGCEIKSGSGLGTRLQLHYLYMYVHCSRIVCLANHNIILSVAI